VANGLPSAKFAPPLAQTSSYATDYCVSLYKPMAVYGESEQQYTAAGGEVQVLRGGIYVWRKVERQEVDTRVGKANAILRELSLRGHKTAAFKHRQLSAFKSIFVPILTYGYESWVMTERIFAADGSRWTR